MLTELDRLLERRHGARHGRFPDDPSTVTPWTVEAPSGRVEEQPVTLGDLGRIPVAVRRERHHPVGENPCQRFPIPNDEEEVAGHGSTILQGCAEDRDGRHAGRLHTGSVA